MSGKVRNPNETSKGFLWAVLALVVIAVAVIAYVVISGQQAKSNQYAEREQTPVSFDLAAKDGVIQLKAANAKKDAANVDLYEDFSCHYCAQLAEATDADMKKAIEAGTVVVNVHSMRFLDDGQDGHSTAAGTAVYTVAKMDTPAVYWNYREVLMKDQQNLYGKDIAELAQIAANLGASAETVEAIKSGQYQDEFKKLADGNEKKLEKVGQKVSSPRVFIDGTEIQGQDMYSWVAPYLK